MGMSAPIFIKLNVQIPVQSESLTILFNLKTEVSMKRLMFLLVSAFIATTSYCANVSENIANVFGGNEETTQIEKQKKQPLVLQKAVDMVKSSLAGHYSHSSHVSHSSHRSHYSSR